MQSCEKNGSYSRLTIGVTLTTGIIQFYVLTPVYQASTQILVHQVGEKRGAPHTAIFKSIFNTHGHSKRFENPVIWSKSRESLIYLTLPAGWVKNCNEQ
ncbi:hypothetical protein PO124_11505 [Bacillus licheniformis]|nr:hypothetical protein [Bacillus licheniformis]